MNFRAFYENKSAEIAGWIFPNGDVELIPIQQHSEYVIKNNDKFNIEEEELNELVKELKSGGEALREKIINLAMLKGAVRFSTVYDTMTVFGRVPIIKYNIETLEKVINIKPDKIKTVAIYMPGKYPIDLTVQEFSLGNF